MSANRSNFGNITPSDWPGERLGLVKNGTGSVARAGRRIAAVVIDWGVATLIALLFAPYSSVAHSIATLIVFTVMQIVLIPTLGGSVGHRIMGMRIVPLATGWVGLWRPVVRTLLLIIVLPALVWDSDQRGFHDKVAGTVLIRS